MELGENLLNLKQIYISETKLIDETWIILITSWKIKACLFLLVLPHCIYNPNKCDMTKGRKVIRRKM